MNTQKAVRQVCSVCLKVSIFVLVFLGIVYLGQTTYRYTRAVFCEEAFEEAPGKTAKIKLSADVSLKKFAQVLEKNGLIEDAKVFEFQLKLKQYSGPVKAGTYELNTSMTPGEILKVLRSAEKEEGQ